MRNGGVGSLWEWGQHPRRRETGLYPRRSLILVLVVLYDFTREDSLSITNPDLHSRSRDHSLPRRANNRTTYLRTNTFFASILLEPSSCAPNIEFVYPILHVRVRVTTRTPDKRVFVTEADFNKYNSITLSCCILFLGIGCCCIVSCFQQENYCRQLPPLSKMNYPPHNSRRSSPLKQPSETGCLFRSTSMISWCRIVHLHPHDLSIIA